MNRFVSHVALSALVCWSSPLLAQDNADGLLCPDQVILRVPPTIVASNIVACGIGMQMNLPGVTYTAPPGCCALFLVYTPEHASTTHRAGSNTYTQPAGSVATYIGRYRCRRNTFLFFTWGGECEEMSFGAADRVVTYVQYTCRE